MPYSPEEELKNIREIILAYQTIYYDRLKVVGSDMDGVRLGLSDALMEEVLLLTEFPHLQEKSMSEKDIELYEQAKQRAIDRDVTKAELAFQSVNAFRMGLELASGTLTPSLYPVEVVSLIKTETNFAFAFVLGVLAKLEAVKGKNYQASWQKRGEAGVLANIQRKFDRLDAMLSLGKTNGDETLTENLSDLAVYSLKMVTLRAELSPEEFTSWLRGIQEL